VGGGTYYNNAPPDAANHPGNWNVQCNSNGQWLYVVLGPYNGASTASITTAAITTILAGCLVTTPNSTAGGTTAFGWFDNTGNTTPNGVWFSHDNLIHSGSDNWWANVVMGGVSTSTDTGVLATAWHELGIVTAGAAVTFSIDGASVGTGSGIATANYVAGLFANNNNGQNTDPFFDWFAAQLDFPR
jgi:hypothetical protein